MATNVLDLVTNMKGIKFINQLGKTGVYLLAAVLIVPFVSLLLLVDPESMGQVSKIIISKASANTFQLLIGVVLLSNVWAITGAWLVSRYEFFGKKVFEWALMLPLAIPPFIMAYTYKHLLGPFGTTHRLFDDYLALEGLIPVMVFMSFSLYPYIYIFLKSTIQKNTGLFINASQSLGRSSWYSFIKVVVPVNIKAIFGGSIIVGMEVLNNYGAVKYFGVKTFTTVIIDSYNPMDPSNSFNTSVVLLMFVLGILFLENTFNRNKKFGNLENGGDFSLGKQSRSKSLVHQMLLGIILLFCFLLPTSQLLFWSWQEIEYLLDDEFTASIFSSISLGVEASIIIVLVALIIQGFARYHSGKVFRTTKEITSMGYAIPGAVLGLGILFVAGKLSHWTGVLLTGGTGVLIYAYISRFLSIGNNSLQSGYAKISTDLMLASKNLGKSNWSSFWKIDLPLLKSSLASALIIVFVDVIKELPLTMLFQRFNFETLAVKAFGLMETDGGVYKAAIPSLLIILIGLIPVYLINKRVK